jgi:hypothetical protein
MKFQYKAKRLSNPKRRDGALFTVDRLFAAPRPEEAREVSHLIDRTYSYHSPRELAWHLADRFGLPTGSIELDRI